MRPFLWPWVPVMGCMLFIFCMSTDMGSSEHTSRFVEPLLRWLHPKISSERLGTVHFLIRKCAHLTEYAVLGVLLWRALTLSRFRSFRAWHWQTALVALAMAAAYGASDEFHQLYVSSRGSSLHDVLIDSCGATIGLSIIWIRRQRVDPQKSR